jgi:hypothetical protein
MDIYPFKKVYRSGRPLVSMAAAVFVFFGGKIPRTPNSTAGAMGGAGGGSILQGGGTGNVLSTAAAATGGGANSFGAGGGGSTIGTFNAAGGDAGEGYILIEEYCI